MEPSRIKTFTNLKIISKKDEKGRRERTKNMKTKRQEKDTKKLQKSQHQLPDLAAKKEVRGGTSLNYTKPGVEYKPQQP
jgi:hypothetical protein